MSLQKSNAHKFTVEVTRGARNRKKRIKHKGNDVRGTIIIIRTVDKYLVWSRLSECPIYDNRRWVIQCRPVMGHLVNTIQTSHGSQCQWWVLITPSQVMGLYHMTHLGSSNSWDSNSPIAVHKTESTSVSTTRSCFRSQIFSGRRETVYYETIKRERNKIFIYECRCDERLKLEYMVLRGGLDWVLLWNDEVKVK
jgi:hypothetical protein